MRLALSLGMTLAELGERMDSDEFTSWLAYDQIHGLPDPWLQTGILATVGAAPYRAKGSKPPVPSDYIRASRPDLKKPKRQSVAQMQAAMDALRKRR